MARKRKAEEHENHERWLVSYADFITLLFAFFVVMYSISSVNEGKYRVLSSSMVSAFSQPAQSLSPIRYGKDLKSPVLQHKVMMDPNSLSRVGVDHQVVPSTQEIAQMQMIADEVEKKLRELVEQDIVNIHKTNKGVEIEIKSNILFSSGQAVLQASAKPTLVKIADVLKDLKNQVNVEGFTDNVPIHTLVFPSNWELSAARAANVVHLFSKSGISPKRLSAIGYGEFKPQASNATPEGRKKNRRINIVVLNRKEKDRKRLTALEPGAIAGVKKINPIGESIRNAMEQGLVLPLPMPQPVAEPPVSPPSMANPIKAPTLLGGAPDRDQKPKEQQPKDQQLKQQPQPMRLPPPKLLPLGKGMAP